MKYKYIIIVIIFILILFCIIFFKPKKNNNIKNINKLIYSKRNNMSIYGYTSYEIECNNECSAKIKPNGISEEDTKVVVLDNETMNKIEKILNKYKVSRWNGFKKTNKNVKDGRSFTFKVVYDNNKEVEASGYMKWPNNFDKVSKELDEIFNELYNK